MEEEGEGVGGRGRDGEEACSIEILDEHFLVFDYVIRRSQLTPARIG